MRTLFPYTTLFRSFACFLYYNHQVHRDFLITLYVRTYILTSLLTYSIEDSPFCKTNRFAASQEIPRILWSPDVHHGVALPLLADVGTCSNMDGSFEYIEWTADMGRSSSLGVGRGANISSL
jgi:hypothetical protein